MFNVLVLLCETLSARPGYSDLTQNRFKKSLFFFKFPHENSFKSF